MNSRTYTRFIPHENNVNQVIDAEHINVLQETLEDTQEEVFRQADTAFLHQCLFTLEHHPDANAMIVDLLEDSSKWNHGTMENVSYDSDIHSLVLDAPNQTEGKVVSKVIYNKTGKPFRKLLLLVDEYKPLGTDIQYEVSHDNINYYSITPNIATPMTLPNEKAQLFLRVTFRRDAFDVVPRIDAWALLYQDETYLFRFLDGGLTINIESDWDGTIVP